MGKKRAMRGNSGNWRKKGQLGRYAEIRGHKGNSEGNGRKWGKLRKLEKIRRT